ncbi:MAG: FimV/HubP family polar landmark protein, partial [Rhodanobacter sp.]
MNRSLKLSMLMALALGTSQAMALDLGQIQVKSTLGQPLLAEIPLHPASPAELQNLTVQLASSEDFARAGIQGGRTSIPLHFSVASTGNGQQVIRITSSVVVDDPYIDLLLEVNGKAGKSVREFAILLDPPGTPVSAPTLAPAPAAATAAASTSSAPSQAAHATVASAPRQNHPAPVSKAAAAAPAAVAKGNYGPVERGQTLSSIARRTMPSGVDVNQMLVAFKQANPEAFYRDNINALKTGAVLRVPTSDEAQAMTVAAAVAAVQRENGDWRAGATSKPTTVADAATRSSSSSTPTGTSGTSSDRLALVPAKDVNGAGGQSGTSASTGGKSAAGLRQDLLRTQESLATLQQQGNDLTARLKDLTDINGKNEHLLSLKDNEIAELQGELAKARKAAGLPPVAAVTGTAASGTA